MTTLPRVSVDEASRAYFIANAPRAFASDVVTGVTPAGQAIVEIPFAGRYYGAVQVVSSDGEAVSATFKVQGTLRPGIPTRHPVTSELTFTAPSVDADWVDIGSSITNTGVVQVAGTWNRLRVICTVFGSGAPVVWIL